jgi:hypothetical protein
MRRMKKTANLTRKGSLISNLKGSQTTNIAQMKKKLKK